MNYYRFFRANWKILLFAILLALFSGFGQTFLLSLYIPSILSDIKLSHTLYSTLYASATLLSGVSIIFVGKLIDRVPLKAFAFAVILGFIAANIAASFAFNPISLFFAIFLLRFFGQGLLSHTAMTAMGRYFSKARGKALSVAYLGFPIAEGLFPIIIVLAISVLGWRQSFQLSALSVLVLLLPISFFLLRNFKKENIKEDFDPNVPVSKSAINEKIWTQKEIIKDRRLYILAPTAFLVGFILTALFFFQTFIAEYKGWSIEWMAGNITAYAVASFMFSIIAGPIIDKFSAKKVFPYILIPMIIGLLCLILFNNPISTTLFWFLVGVSAGLNPTVSNAIYAEEFGTLSLGTVRSLFTFVMIASTALGPITYSLLLNASLSFNTIHLLLISLIIINALMLYIALIKKSKSKKAPN